MDQQSQTPQQRQRPLNPFLRKPLWVILEDDCNLSSTEGTTNSNNAAGATSSVVHHENAATGDSDVDDNGIELPSRVNGGDRNEEFSFEYRDHDDHDHTSPLADRTSSQSQKQPHHAHHSLPPRHLTLFDLVSIGVGGTIGSGIFVLNGLIAHSYAGPATFLSWIISGIAALLSGCCYAELSGRIPSAGSSYAYAFVALGELPAFVTAGMLSLEFMLSGSAVAR